MGLWIFGTSFYAENALKRSAISATLIAEAVNGLVDFRHQGLQVFEHCLI